MNTFKMQYEEYKTLIDEYLLDFLPKVDCKSETLEESMKYSLNAGGKRIRPILLLAACKFANDELDVREALPFAAAAEYIHTYSLIHDDLPAMDDDDLRRGIATNHKVFGEDMAILAGDGLLNSAFEAMTKEILTEFDNIDMMKRKIKAMNSIVVASGVRGMIAGQVADIEAEGKAGSEEMLDYINMNKTGAILVGVVSAGCHIGAASSQELRDMSDYAEYLGLAFQIKDDILDIEGDENIIGKPVGSDRNNNKFTYPDIYGMQKAKDRLKNITQKAVSCMEKYGERGSFFVELAKKMEYRRN